MEKTDTGTRETVCVIGLGYVGLQLAVAFARAKLDVIGYDVGEKRIAELKKGNDRTNEIDGKTLSSVKIDYTTDSQEIKKADFVIIAVPTPITKAKKPDLSFIESSAKTVGKNLKKNAIVVLESTVYPGVTEEILVPVMEEASGMKCGKDFKAGYSPERINPGDKEHTINKIVKVVSGMDSGTTESIAKLYGKITTVFKARDIKTAEAAKVIENIQRDLNIALVNELSMIFNKIGIDTREVLSAAGTKWNFHKYVPGLVGGHCIPVDPYYLVYKAEALDYHPQVILAGRAINDHMPKHVADLAIKGLNSAGKVLRRSNVLIMGLTFKENVKDTRTSKASDLIKELREFGIHVLGYDPLLDVEVIREHFKIDALTALELGDIDAVIIMSPHDEIKKIPLSFYRENMKENPVIVDVSSIFDPMDAKNNKIIYKRL